MSWKINIEKDCKCRNNSKSKCRRSNDERNKRENADLKSRRGRCRRTVDTRRRLRREGCRRAKRKSRGFSGKAKWLSRDLSPSSPSSNQALIEKSTRLKKRRRHKRPKNRRLKLWNSLFWIPTETAGGKTKNTVKEYRHNNNQSDRTKMIQP